ncbi:MAG: ABC transporter permease [Planctomycetes bacterium]|nr:ABC transporter permease [Planctomycetota bacterium]
MKLAKLVGKNLRRRPMRTALTVLGVASAMLLFVLVESLSAGLDHALSGSESARTLIVYRENRYCPQTSFLPQWYGERIAKLPGVASVLPVKVYLNNCRASLDLVAFQGAPAEELLATRGLTLEAGAGERFVREKDSALVGRAFAARKNLAVGDNFRFGNIHVKVVGIFASDEPVEEGVILTHLEFLQRAGPVNRLGTVTQFEVKIDDATRAEAISAQIDDVLVGNTVLMSVQERVKEFGVFRTLGFRASHVAQLVVVESLALSLAGGALGFGLALLIIRFAHVSIGSEGVAIEFVTSPRLALLGLGVATVCGILASLAPAVRSARAEIVVSLRSA